MRFPVSDFTAPLFTALGLSVAVAVFVSETRSFRDAVFSWARRDLEARAELAASTLRDPVATGDFRAIHEFGAKCSAEGLRLTVLSAPGGIVFDSVRQGETETESIFAVRPCGEFGVRLGLPVSTVLAPYRRARIGFILAGLIGGTGVLSVLLFTFRQRARVRELARERDSQKKLLEELRKVEAFRRDFIADVSHEIKTPLTGIIGAVDLLASSAGLPENSRDRLLAMLKMESERLNGLAQGILSLAKIERDMSSGAPDFGPVDLAEITRDAVERMKVAAADAGMEISAEVPESCAVTGDAQLLSSAVSNLLSNAVRHSGASGVSVSLSGADGSAVLTVEDHGVGIPPEARGRVFDRFFRVDGSRDSGSGGSGLGLAITRGIARLHGGDVTLEPAEPSGCRFLFSVKRQV